MSSTYYTSLSGMMAASYGLQNTSNNVANMHSVGFKRNDVFYSSLGGSGGHDGLGSGVYVGGHSTNFSAGTYLDTANPSDLAIVGNGFFIVKLKNGELLYTRSGDFGFNTDGLMIDNHSHGLVQGYNKQGSLVPISQFGPHTSPGKATSEMKLSGEFVAAELDSQNKEPSKSNYLPIRFDASVYGTDGKAHLVSFEFQTPPADEIHPEPGYQDYLHWKLISASCHDAKIEPKLYQELIFEDNAGGIGSERNHKIQFTLNGDQDVTINFGSGGDDIYSSVRLWKLSQTDHPDTKIKTKKQDGYGMGKQIGASFDENGQISYSYDNGQSIDGLHVALATFDDMDHSLVQAHDNLFRAKNTRGQHIGRPNKQGFGTIQPKKLESANVDSTTEFANIVVLQRMFQACSQIMDIDKQLLEEIYKK